MDPIGLCLILTIKLVLITALISLPNTFPISTFYYLCVRYFLSMSPYLANNTLPTDMAGYATKPSLAFFPPVSGVTPLKPLIFYIPHGNSP